VALHSQEKLASGTPSPLCANGVGAPKGEWCGILQTPVSPTEDKKAGRFAVGYDKEN